MEQTLIVISNIDFYNKKGAAHTRIMNYATSLSSEKKEILLSSRYNFISTDNELIESENKEVRFFGLPKQKEKKSTNNVYLENIYIPSFYRYIKQVFKYSEKHCEKRSFLLYPGNLALILVSLFYLRLIKREKVFIEKNELMLGIALNYPLSKNPVKFLPLLLMKIFLFFIYLVQDILTPFFSGIIVISTKLQRLYKPFNKKIIRVPILVETFTGEEEKIETDSFAIGYSGEINQSKEGFFTFLNVFAKLCQSYNIKLHIWGGWGNKTNLKKVNHIIEVLNLKDAIFFHPFLNQKDLQKEITKVQLLVLPRPDNLQTRFGFSNKLGEYLMSGAPVLITEVGDNGLYIKDGRNGFVVKKSSEELLYNKMVHILEKSNADLNKVGGEGKITAINNFDCMVYVRSLSDFLFK